MSHLNYSLNKFLCFQAFMIKPFSFINIRNKGLDTQMAYFLNADLQSEH